METQIKKSDREKAIEWWNSLSNFESTSTLPSKSMFSFLPGQKHFENFTNEEIELIWRKETQ